MTRAATVLSLLLLVVCGVAAAAIGLGFLGRLHPALDSFSHFRLHLAALLAVGAFGLIPAGFRREAFAGLALATGAVFVTPGTWFDNAISNQAKASAAPDDRATYRLLHLNARFDHSEPGRFLSLIARLHPDVVTVNEVSAMWRQRLETLSAAYPYSTFCDARGEVGGVAILSRRPLAQGATGECIDGGTLAIAPIDFAGEIVTVAALHLYWPWPFEQPAQVERIAPRLSQLPDATILAGDFNAARWSQTFSKIAASSRLEDAGPVGPSWLPRSLPDALRRAVGLGIDHVLAGAGVIVTKLERAEGVGSDHLPVLTEFWVPSQARPEASGTTVVLKPAATSPGA
ncbi:endonuclease/exonuclease/phosphatase family protein [Mesorhizobium sp. J428]|uniref:endonuclease/exonuclease/phosphatase family protein n=1 Tax=Mesorhizobium sp. J428 TaxID=2898440 RepID=UPI00215079D2|nr:endonuclease/exonuclease/phosphatase family protein [Mesorhizobium sp. J428]MCR5858951.1 endonuclease/exonuclease/phosphatase family protein [Mesorhizobium sp. J428]